MDFIQSQKMLASWQSFTYKWNVCSGEKLHSSVFQPVNSICSICANLLSTIRVYCIIDLLKAHNKHFKCFTVIV